MGYYTNNIEEKWNGYRPYHLKRRIHIVHRPDFWKAFSPPKEAKKKFIFEGRSYSRFELMEIEEVV